MISLCRSYDCAWNSWHNFQSDDAASDPDTPGSNLDSASPRTLEEAVEEFPEMALHDLAEVLGLDLDRLDQALRQYEDFAHKRQHGAQQQRKRSPTSLAVAHNTKRPRPRSLPRQSRPSPPALRYPDSEVIKGLLRYQSSSSPSLEPSEHMKLGWAVNSEALHEYQEAERKRRSSAIPERPSPKSKKSQGPSQETNVQGLTQPS